MTQEFVNIKRFGKDHWSMLAYVECCVVDNIRLDLTRMRVNSKKRGFYNGVSLDWNNSYGTRLDDGSILPNHDDIDIIDDLENAKFLKNLGTAINPMITLTDYGHKIVNKLRKHKADGNVFADFKP